MNEPESGTVTISANPATGDVTADAAPTLHTPTARTTDFLWSAVIVTCCALIFIAGVALVAGMFVGVKGFVAVELVQGVFLVVFGFIAGLLAPSPSRR